MALSLESEEAPSERAIESRPCPDCSFCGTQGILLHAGLVDWITRLPGRWNVRRCPTETCGLLWLDPMPTETGIPLAYPRDYYTHGGGLRPGGGWARTRFRSLRNGVFELLSAAHLQSRLGYRVGVGPPWLRWLGPLASFHPGGREEIDARAMFLRAPESQGRVLDVGCGSGWVLACLRDLGWETVGVDLDPAAVAAGRRKGLRTDLGTLEQQAYPDDWFDAITLNHVIEHLHQPDRVVRECHRILKPGGTLVIITPNPAGWGHRRFGRDWRGLDPPRHLWLFNRRTLGRLLDGTAFVPVRVQTLTKFVPETFFMSELIRARRVGRRDPAGLAAAIGKASAFAAQLRERALRVVDREAGEEVLLIARKPAVASAA